VLVWALLKMQIRWS